MKKCSNCGIFKETTEFKKGVSGNRTNSMCYCCRKQKNREYYKEYYQRNKEAKKEKSRIYRQTHKKAIQEKRNIYEKKKMLTDPQFRLRKSLRKRFRNALLNQTANKKHSVLRYLGCTVEEARLHLESLFKEGMTWETHGEWHIDHIRPCSSFDLTKDEEVQACFHYSNLQPLWKHENLSKGSSY